MKSTQQHTPGPWSCDVADQPIIVNGPDDSGNIVALVYDKKCAPEHTDPEHHYSEEVAAANARLIAAAPDLFAALERCAESCAAMVERGKDCDPYDMAEAMLADMRAALAKAKGEA